MIDYKAIAFDLDGTLTESKALMDGEMIDLLRQLMKKYYLIIVSGANEEQFDAQVIDEFKKERVSLDNIFLVATNGAQIFVPSKRMEIYRPKNTFAPDEIVDIVTILETILPEFEWANNLITFGPQIENRYTQITFSALGQHAPVAIKKNFDPDMVKRRALRDRLIPLLPKCDITIGGMTSIDITKKGINKSHGLLRIMEYLGIESKDEVLYIGDALQPDGNDACMIAAGFPYVNVRSVEETKKFIKLDLLAKKTG